MDRERFDALVCLLKAETMMLRGRIEAEDRFEALVVAGLMDPDDVAVRMELLSHRPMAQIPVVVSCHWGPASDRFAEALETLNAYRAFPPARWWE